MQATIGSRPKNNRREAPGLDHIGEVLDVGMGPA